MIWILQPNFGLVFGVNDPEMRLVRKLQTPNPLPLPLP